jgi:hypothetical protein
MAKLTEEEKAARKSQRDAEQHERIEAYAREQAAKLMPLHISDESADRIAAILRSGMERS